MARGAAPRLSRLDPIQPEPSVFLRRVDFADIFGDGRAFRIERQGRREFLGQGFIAGTATVAAPSILSLLGARDASAQMACALTGAGAGMVPFIAIDLGGGANIAASNVSVGGPGGQEDPLDENGYERLGLPLDMTPLNGAIDSYDRTMNLRFHFDSALTRNWSMITCAALLKSPNCASQSTRSSGASRL